MEAILVLKITGRSDDWELYRAKNLTRCLDYFWEDTDLLRLHVVAPADELEVIRKNIISTKIEVIFHNEDDVLHGITDFLSSGWMKQQALKIAAHRIISEEFYLTLDADLVCLKGFGACDFIREGLACNDWSPTNVNHSWWVESSKLIGLDTIPSVGLGVTPQVLSVEACANLEIYLNIKYGDDALLKLTASPGWTEYSIYNCFLLICGTLQKYHQPPEFVDEYEIAHRFASKNLNIWHPRQYLTWDPSLPKLSASRGKFMVLQSRAEIPPILLFGRLEHSLFDVHRNELHNHNLRDISVVEFLFAIYDALLLRELDLVGLKSHLKTIASTRDLTGVIKAVAESLERQQVIGKVDNS